MKKTINTLLVLTLLCCSAGMFSIAQQPAEPQAKDRPQSLAISTTLSGSTWTMPVYTALKINGWLEMRQSDQPEKSVELCGIDFRPANSVLMVKNEPVVTKRADGTWDITFKPATQP